MKFLGFGIAAILAVVIAFIGLSALSNFSDSVHNNAYLNMNWIEVIISIPIAIAILLASISFLGEGSETLWNFAAVISWFLFLLTLIRGLCGSSNYFLIAIFLGIGVLASITTSSKLAEKLKTGAMPALFFVAMIGAIVVMLIS